VEINLQHLSLLDLHVLFLLDKEGREEEEERRRRKKKKKEEERRRRRFFLKCWSRDNIPEAR